MKTSPYPREPPKKIPTRLSCAGGGKTPGEAVTHRGREETGGHSKEPLMDASDGSRFAGLATLDMQCAQLFTHLPYRRRCATAGQIRHGRLRQSNCRTDFFLRHPRRSEVSDE